MANIAIKRIRGELIEFEKSDGSNKENFTMEIVDNNVLRLKVSLKGPPDTPFEGGRFFLDVNIGEKYPFEPPKVKFTTHLWHPNVSSVTGAICLDILKSNWEASMSVQSILVSLQVLMQEPRPEDPQDAVVAGQYIRKGEEYKKTAAYWTAVFAKQGSGVRKQDKFKDYEDKVKTVKVKTKNKFSEDKVVGALSCHDWNTIEAIKALE